MRLEKKNSSIDNEFIAHNRHCFGVRILLTVFVHHKIYLLADLDLAPLFHATVRWANVYAAAPSVSAMGQCCCN